MSGYVRDIVKIDEEKCDGCGDCVPSCAEGAIEIMDGKARLVAENLCDGLGNCLGVCPKGAITIERRKVEPFDEEAVSARLQKTPVSHGAAVGHESATIRGTGGRPPTDGCPGSMSRKLRPAEAASAGCPSAFPRTVAQAASCDARHAPSVRSRLGHWPVQLLLLPVKGEMWNGADVLVAADCVAFAMPDFHEKLLNGRTLAIGCPKLDDASAYAEKLATVFSRNRINSVTVAHMEVPCCGGIVMLVKHALEESGRRDIKFQSLVVGIDGRIEEETEAGMGRSGRPRIAGSRS